MNSPWLIALSNAWSAPQGCRARTRRPFHWMGCCMAAIVRRAGAIVYSVCSIAPEEGEGVVDGFLARHGDFEIDRAVAADGVLKNVIDARGFMKTRPDVGGLDGFFAARLVRRRFA